MERVTEIIKKVQPRIEQERENRRRSVEDMLFVDADDGQWTQETREMRKDRPRFTVDQISGEIDTIVGNQRQTDTGIDVLPLNGGTEDLAETYSGIIRYIEQRSSAENIYDQSFTDTLKSGYGGWRVLTEFGSETLDPKAPTSIFDQNIIISPIDTAVSSLYFARCKDHITCKDAPWALLITDYTREEFKAAWPNAIETGFDIAKYPYAYKCDWVTEDKIRVAEFWEKKPKKKTLALLSDERVIDLEEEADVIDELADQGIKIVRTREVESYDITMEVINAAEVLEGPNKWEGKYIPLIPEYGKISIIQENKFIRGFVRKAKDPQRIYNYSISTNIETVALAPKDPILMTATQYGKHGLQWKTFNKQNPPIALYEHDTGGAPPPFRLGAPAVQEAIIQQTNQAYQDIQAALGVKQFQERSLIPKTGDALDAEQGQNDNRTYVYQNHHDKSIQYTGEILVDLIPRIMDTERIVKILNADGTTEDVKINETIIDQETLKPVIVNDLSQGEYGVVVRTGPATPTKRKETVRQLTELPDDIIPLMLDIIVDNMDLNNGKEVKKRVRKIMIQNGTVEPTPEEKQELGLDQPPPPDPMQEALVQNLAAQTDKLLMEQEKMIAEIRNKDADTQNKHMAAQNAAINSIKELIEALSKKIESGGAIMPEEEELLEGAVALGTEATIDVLENQEVADSLPMNAKQVQGEIQPGYPQPSGPVGPQPGVDIPEGFEVP
jgi:hypothetical protein